MCVFSFSPHVVFSVFCSACNLISLKKSLGTKEPRQASECVRGGGAHAEQTRNRFFFSPRARRSCVEEDTGLLNNIGSSFLETILHFPVKKSMNI